MQIFFLSLLVCVSVCRAELIFGIGGLYMPETKIYVKDMLDSHITRDESLRYQGGGVHIMGGGFYGLESVDGLGIRGYVSFSQLKGNDYLTMLGGIGINMDVVYDVRIASGFGIGLFAGAEAGVSHIKFSDDNVPSTGLFTPYANAGVRVLFLHKHSIELFVKYPIAREYTLLKSGSIDISPNQPQQYQYLRDMTFAPIFGLRYVITLSLS